MPQITNLVVTFLSMCEPHKRSWCLGMNYLGMYSNSEDKLTLCPHCESSYKA